MPCRAHRAVATLLVLAAGLQAADEVVIPGARGTLRAQVADEIQVETQAAPGRRAQRQAVAVSGGRAAVQQTAKRLLASGQAVSAAPVLYVDGRTGDPHARIVVHRQLYVSFAPGTDIGSALQEHGLRPVEALAGGTLMVEPVSPDILAPIDAAKALAQDKRCAQVWPQMDTPVSRRMVPNDPMLVDGLVWHLDDAHPGIHVREVWDNFTGTGAGVAITDGGIQTDHLDLVTRYYATHSRDYFTPDADPRPTVAGDNHGTWVAGLALATGNNNIGTTGVAWDANFVASKLIETFNAGRDTAADYLPTDAKIRQGLVGTTVPGAVSSMLWVNNCSWGPVDDSLDQDLIGPLTLQGMWEATTIGRGGRGTVLVFPAGNGGAANPNDLRPPPRFGPFPSTQDCTAFDPYLTRYVIGVGAIAPIPPPELKYAYSESGPNLTISAPGYGLVTTDRSSRSLGNPHPSQDTLGAATWPVPNYSANFDGLDDPFGASPPPLDFYVWNDPGYSTNVGDPDNLTYENGDYAAGMTGTSFAAPLVSGAAALMLQARPQLSWRDVRAIFQSRGQNYLPTPFGNPGQPHDPWGHWRANAVGMQYNNWYGFGGLDVGNMVFGGNGTFANRNDDTARDQPGALRWPLLPPMWTGNLFYEETYPYPPLGSADPKAVYDAPKFGGPPETNIVNRNLVWNPGRGIELLDGIDRAVYCQLPISGVPPRFRVEAVEVTVRLRDVGDNTYNPNPVPIPGPTGPFNTGDYVYHLTSPSGSTCILGRQRPVGTTIDQGEAYQVTMTELFHVNELAEGTWTLSVLDEANDLDDDTLRDVTFGNPPECRVEYASLRVFGHQTYDVPRIASIEPTGLVSDEGDQTVTITGSGFASSGGGVGVTQAYWDDGTGEVEIPTTIISATQLRVTVPTSLLPDIPPGQGTLFIANPAVVIGRAGGVDDFDPPVTQLNTAAVLPVPPPAATPTRPMKRCPGTDDQTVRYSRRPTLTAINDLYLPSGGAFSVTTTASDPDVLAGLPVGLPESLTVTVNSYNPGFSGPLTVTSPGAPGVGTYTIAGNVPNSGSGFAFIEVRVTDGVVTTTETFRVIIPTDEDGSGCGGGMGLALIGVPLAAWFIRRRRRG